MSKIDKESKKEMTIGEICRTILREGSNAILDFIYSIGEKDKRWIEIKLKDFLINITI